MSKGIVSLFVWLGFACGQSVNSQDARRSPEFLNRAIAYQIWMRAFTPEGTLQAAAKKLPHIAGLGASIVYLSPIQLMSRVGGFSNPYRIKDYYAIDPEYGTEEDLKAFLADAHRLGLKVLMDMVYFHTGPDSVMMSTPQYYMHQDGQIVLGQWRLPRPDFDNPKLREYLIHNLLHWARDVGADGFRCDVSGGIPVDFWERARAALDEVNQNLIMLAESEKPDEMLKAFDISYNFSHQRTITRIFREGESASALRANWEKTRAMFPRSTRFLRASDNHDQRRAIVEFSEPGTRAASVINFTLDGIPFLYNGQEIADTTGTDHQSHYPIRWELDKPEGQTGSALARPQKQLVAWYTRLLHMRLEQPALTTGDVVWISNSQPDSIVSFVRQKGDDRFVVLVNVSNRRCLGTAEAPAGWPETLLNGNGDTLKGSRFELSPFGYVVAKLK